MYFIDKVCFRAQKNTLSFGGEIKVFPDSPHFSWLIERCKYKVAFGHGVHKFKFGGNGFKFGCAG